MDLLLFLLIFLLRSSQYLIPNFFPVRSSDESNNIAKTPFYYSRNSYKSHERDDTRDIGVTQPMNNLVVLGDILLL